MMRKCNCYFAIVAQFIVILFDWTAEGQPYKLTE